MNIGRCFALLLLLRFAVSACQAQVTLERVSVDPLPSWNETAPKRAVMEFVKNVTTKGNSEFVPVPERVAVFDNDGTLWPEAPIPFQAAFAFDELKRRAPQEPDLASDAMVRAALAGDIGKLLSGKHHDGLLHVLGLTHAGMTTDEFDLRVNNWLASAGHPRFNKPYDQLTYRPMQELLRYLRAHGFKTFIVSGGGADFMRVWSERVYGIPPENVIGSTGRVQFQIRDDVPVLVKTIDHLFVDDKEGKPVGIHHFIGRRPIACFGNSDGDQAMLEYTTIGNPHSSFGMIIHHTDADREYAYDANPKGSGKLITALQAAPNRGWQVVDMKEDWKHVWGDAKKEQQSAPSTALIGNWLAEDISGRGVVDRAQSTLKIEADGSVTGNSAVNRFFGNAQIDGDMIKFGPLGMTRRAGPPALMDQESKYTAALGKTRRFRIDERGILFLIDADGQDLIRLSRIQD